MKNSYQAKIKKGKFRQIAGKKDDGFRVPKRNTLDRLLKPGMKIEP